MSGQSYACKDCGDSFEIPFQEMRKYGTNRLGLSKWNPPVRCVKCREIHRKQVKNLGRVVVSIPNAQSGEGCYLALTTKEIGTIASWGTTTFPWASVAPSDYPESAQAVVFNVDQKTTGAVYFEVGDPKKGLVVKALDYAPWIDDYEGARRAIPLYLIAESMRRGYDGRFTIVPNFKEIDFYKNLGMEPTNREGEYQLSTEAAQLLLLADEGLREETIKKLFAKAKNGDADVSWIAQKVIKGKLAAEMVDEITSAQSHISWNDFKTYIEHGETLDAMRRLCLERKLQGLFGQLKAMEYLRSIDPDITAKMEMPLMHQHIDVMVQFKKDVTIKRCVTYDPKIMDLVATSVTLKQSQGCAIECKAWKPSSYKIPGNIQNLVKEVSRASSVVKTVIVMVTSDFNMLDTGTQTHVVEQITAAGGVLKVIPEFSAGSARYHAGRFSAFAN